MENIGSNINLFKFIPDQLKYKLLKLEKQNINEKAEISVIFNGDADKVNGKVIQLGGVFTDLGYGFGIVALPVSSVERISEISEIIYVELPKILYTTYLPSNQESCIPKVWTEYGLTGKGVVVGVIDSGIDYTHPAFKTTDNKTRIKYIYDIYSGEIWDETQINEALQAQDPYSIVPQSDNNGHGTHVTSIACGGGDINRRYYGVAYESNIIMVKMTREGQATFTKSTQIMRAIKFLIEKGRELRLPIVINLSFSTNDGAHDGNSILELYIKTIASLERVSICIAAGNEGEASHHAGGIIVGNYPVLLNIGAQESIITLQLYKNFVDNILIEIVSPIATSSGKIDISKGNYFEGTLGFDKYYIYNSGPSPFNIIGEILIIFESLRGSITEGTWTINLYSSKINILNEFDMWLPIAEGLNVNTKFFNPSPYNTVGIPATTDNIISVGSYNCITGNISSFSGRGKANLQPVNPDIVAPGENIEAAFPGGGYNTLSGTSMATPQVAGAAALLTQWGLVDGNDPYMYGQRLRYYIIKGADRTRKDIIYPDPSWGYGRMCLENSLEVWLLEGNSRMQFSIPGEVLDYINKLE